MKNIDRKNLNNFITRICISIMTVGLLIACVIDGPHQLTKSLAYVFWLIAWTVLVVCDKVHLDEDERR
jgi:hypothetical protein